MEQKIIAAVRGFNRFYTDVIGLLNNHILNSDYSLPEVRIMYELFHHGSLTASEIIQLLQLDKGYLSRLLKQFEKKKLVVKTNSEQDGRSANISLTNAGKREFEKLNMAADKQVEDILSLLSPAENRKLIGHMKEIETILQKTKIYRHAGKNRIG